MIYLALFWCYFKIGLLSFGGGYASIALIQSQVVMEHGWLTMTQFTDIVAISQMTPGPIGINCATFVGLSIAGFLGAIVATFSYILPSFIILIILAYLYFRYRNLTVIQSILACLRPAVVALIAFATYSIALITFWDAKNPSFGFKNLNWIAIGLFLGALFLIQKLDLNPIFIMLICGIVGGTVYGLLEVF